MPRYTLSGATKTRIKPRNLRVKLARIPDWKMCESSNRARRQFDSRKKAQQSIVAYKKAHGSINPFIYECGACKKFHIEENRRGNRIYCLKAGKAKTRYVTIEEAMLDVEKMKRRYRNRQPYKIYECDSCEGFHLTKNA